MQNESRYTAYIPDANGHIHYSAEDDRVWHTLYDRQIKLVQNRACNEHLAGLGKLNLAATRISQPTEVSEYLSTLTGWVIESVPSLISFKRFFGLIAQKKFPAASFIRRMEDLDYLPEPDIFHELFGHCPALTDPDFAAFTHKIGVFANSIGREDRIMLARLYWFTIEFGLINTASGLRIYGAGILSSKSESIYALESAIPLRKPFDLIEVLRTPYRYDQMQMIYFVIDGFKSLYQMVEGDKLIDAFAEAKSLGMLPSLYDDNGRAPAYDLEED